MAAIYWPDARVLPRFSPLDPDTAERFSFDFKPWLLDIGWPQLDSAVWDAPGLTISQDVVSGYQALATLSSDGSLPLNAWTTVSVTATAGSQTLQRSARVQLRDM